ncbi:MAG: Imm7 family immunity protein [Saprospiraceae bacterium]
MARLNGWLTDLYGGDKVDKLLKSLSKDYGVQINRNGMNGIVSCSFFLDRNHYGVSFEKTLAVIQEIVKEEKEIDAYGLIYIQDDESKQHHDEFQAYVIKKGEIYKKVDTFFSPCSQEIWNYED